MIDLRTLDKFRVRLEHVGWAGDANHGAFAFRSRAHGEVLRCIATTGYGWDHVSVSLHGVKRCPTWLDMKQVHRTFWPPHEAAMQYHAPEADYVDGENGSGHPYCLHLWRPYAIEIVGSIPVPPKFMIGGMTAAEGDAAADLYEASTGLGVKRGVR